MQSELQNLPVGWRFHPTDEELVDHYLKNKRLGCPISGSDIQDVQFCDLNPWDLIDIDSSSEERYFFSRPEVIHLKSGGVQTKRKGWKRTGSIQFITRKDSDVVIGTKKIFVYHVRDKESTEYVKHEYELTEELESPVQEDNDFVLFKIMIIKKKKASKKLKKVGPPSEKEATVSSDLKFKKKGSLNPKEKEAKNLVVNAAYDDGEPSNHATTDFELQIGSKEMAHPAFGEGDASNLQSPISATAVSTWEKGESSHRGAYGFEDQNKYEMSNTSICDQEIPSFPMEFDFDQAFEETSFLMEPDGNQNYLESSTLSRYSMCGSSSQMMGRLETQNPNDLTTTSLHERSSTSFDNQNLNETNVVSILENERSNQNDTILYTATNQNDTSYHVIFNSENQNPIKESSVSASLERRWRLLEEALLNEKKTDRPDSKHSLGPLSAAPTDMETKFEEFESGHKKTEFPNLEDLGELEFSDINFENLDGLLCLADMEDTLSSEPEPTHSQEPQSGL